MKTTAIILGFVTASGIVFYWASVFSGIFKVIDLVPGYRQWLMSFPLADAWIAVCSLLTALLLLRGNANATPFGLLTGSGLIFLGLYALMYGINTGLIFKLTADEIIEIAIKAYCLSAGSFFIAYFWRGRAS